LWTEEVHNSVIQICNWFITGAQIPSSIHCHSSRSRSPSVILTDDAKNFFFHLPPMLLPWPRRDSRCCPAVYVVATAAHVRRQTGCVFVQNGKPPSEAGHSFPAAPGTGISRSRRYSSRNLVSLDPSALMTCHQVIAPGLSAVWPP
jgi:hypothetical protein